MRYKANIQSIWNKRITCFTWLQTSVWLLFISSSINDFQMLFSGTSPMCCFSWFRWCSLMFSFLFVCLFFRSFAIMLWNYPVQQLDRSNCSSEILLVHLAKFQWRAFSVGFRICLGFVPWSVGCRAAELSNSLVAMSCKQQNSCVLMRVETNTQNTKSWLICFPLLALVWGYSNAVASQRAGGWWCNNNKPCWVWLMKRRFAKSSSRCCLPLKFFFIFIFFLLGYVSLIGCKNRSIRFANHPVKRKKWF